MFSSRSWAEDLNIEARPPSTINSDCHLSQRSSWKSINSNHYRSIRIFWRDSQIFLTQLGAPPHGGVDVEMMNCECLREIRITQLDGPRGLWPYIEGLEQSPVFDAVRGKQSRRIHNGIRLRDTNRVSDAEPAKCSVPASRSSVPSTTQSAANSRLSMPTHSLLGGRRGQMLCRSHPAVSRP